tara:strand:- start:2737 stop:3861 length:1125 start_codon:yes stop_codon:yes gene_type:complete
MEFIDLAAQQARLKPRIDARIAAVLGHGKYIMGPEVAELETELSAFCGAAHTITCANGTDALQLALMALRVGPGDAIFVPSFTFAATAEVAPPMGAVPVFVDVDPISFNMDPDSLVRAIDHARKLGLRPTVVIPVDLFGQAADYTAINAIVAAEGLKMIGDSAQGFGAVQNGKMTGTFGDITTTSFFPAKPLGCYGDGGALFTPDPDIAALLDSYRVHGKGREKYDNVCIGMNSRLDTLQAAILLEKLAVYEDEIAARQKVAERYEAGLANHVMTPRVPEGDRSVWAQYTLRLPSNTARDALAAALKAADIPSVVYYPVPLHQQTAYRDFPQSPDGLETSAMLAQTVLSLPMHPYLETGAQDRVIAVVQDALAS